jgi:uncharacterized 2Fe-2S/4Fe-4S cluster protein (DUF4445 family)
LRKVNRQDVCNYQGVAYGPSAVCGRNWTPQRKKLLSGITVRVAIFAGTKMAGACGDADGNRRGILLQQRDEIARVVKQVEKVETAVEPRFQEHFVHAMAIPHKTEPFPHLAAAVTLPPPKNVTAGQADEGRGRRRRRA